MKSVASVRSKFSSLRIFAAQTVFIAGIVAQVGLPAKADENPFSGDVWSATDKNHGPEVEILSYDELMSLTAVDRRVYILSIQRMLDRALLLQDRLGYAPGNLAENEKVQSYKAALSLFQALLPQAEAARGTPAAGESEDEYQAEDDVKRWQALASTDDGHPCSASYQAASGDYLTCKGFQDSLADAQKKLAEKTAERKAGRSADADADAKSMEQLQKDYDKSGCGKPEKAMDAACVGVKKEIDGLKQKAVAAAHPPLPHADVQAQKDAAAAAKKKADAVKDTIAAERGKCADFTGDDVAYKKCQADADVKIKAAQDDADRAKVEADKAALKLLQDTGTDPQKLSEMRAKLSLGKGCTADQKADEKADVCAAPGKDTVDAKKRQEAINTYNSKLKSSAQCTAGFLPSASVSGSCLAVHSLRIGDKNFICGADTTMCNPWEYGAKKIGDSFDALCAKVPTSGTPKAKSLQVGLSCETLSSENTTARDDFLKAPINGVKDGWEANVRKPLQAMCGGPLRMRANCEVCHRMAADAQLAISSTGKIRKCDGSDDAPAPHKKGTKAQ